MEKIKAKAVKTPKPSLEERGVFDRKTALDFYQNELRQIYNPVIDEEQKKALLATVSLNDLKYLFSLFLSAPLCGRLTKQVILDKIRYVVDSDRRTTALFKDLRRN